MKNFEVVRVLRNISILLEMDDVPFKPRAYEKAAISISALEEDVEEIYMKSCVEGFLIQQLSKVDLKELILKVKANYNKYRSLEAYAALVTWKG
jgi:DNA polymerase/3'-5' exonuclease PolX